MKKILAMVITVMMLLTMAVVMPVSADTTATEEVNLVKNGSFELDNGGTAASSGQPATKDYDLEYWNQVSETVKIFAWWTPATGYDYNPPTDGKNVCYAMGAGAGIWQEISIEDDEPYYVNQDKYSFELSYSTYNYGSRALPVTNVTVADASGATATASYEHVRENQIAANVATYMNYLVLDDLFAQLSAPVKTIRLEFLSNQEISLDNIKLVPVYKTVNFVKNGSFESDKALVNADKAADADRDYDIDEWTQISDSVKMYSWATASTSPYNPPTDGTNVVYVTGAGTKGLYQTITLPDDSEYYINQSDYKYVLSFDTYAGSACVRTAIVTLTTAEGATVTGTYNHVFNATDVVKAKMYHNSFDLTELFNGIALPAKSITVKFETNGELCFDNVKLSPYPADVQETAVNMLVNGGLENPDENGYAEGWRVLEYEKDLHSLYTSEDGIVPEGSHAVKLTNVQGEMVDGKPKSFGGTITQNVRLEKGAYYLLEYKYKAPLPDAALLTISNIVNWNKLAELTIPATAFWSNYKKLIQVDNDMNVEIALRCHPETEGAEVLYDDIKLTKIETPDSNNLVFNGDFEMSAVNEVSPLGWTSSGTGSYVDASTTVAQGNRILKHGFSNVSQTVNIIDFDMSNTDSCKYTLNFDYASPAGGRVTVTVKYAYEDSTYDTSIVYTGARINADGTWNEGEKDWKTIGPLVEEGKTFKYIISSAYSAISIDLKPLMPVTISPLKSITIQFNAVGTPCNIDNVALYCDKSTVEIVDGTGVAVADIADNAAAAYTAKATYYGTDAGAMSYIAVYTKDANGVLRLSKVASAALTGDGVANTSAALTGINAIAGTTVVKAFIMGTEINPVASTMID